MSAPSTPTRVSRVVSTASDAAWSPYEEKASPAIDIKALEILEDAGFSRAKARRVLEQQSRVKSGSSLRDSIDALLDDELGVRTVEVPREELEAEEFAKRKRWQDEEDEAERERLRRQAEPGERYYQYQQWWQRPQIHCGTWFYGDKFGGAHGDDGELGDGASGESDDDSDSDADTKDYRDVPFFLWTPFQVACWLKDIGMARYIPVFEKNRIAGDVLFELSKEDLLDMGMEKAGDRKRILRAIKELRKRELRQSALRKKMYPDYYDQFDV